MGGPKVVWALFKKVEEERKLKKTFYNLIKLAAVLCT